MSDWYDVTGTPGDHAQGASASIRGEFVLIQSAFAKFPALVGNGDKLLKVNSGGTAVEAVASIAVAQGGTGTTTLTDGGILLGSGTGAVTVTARPTLNQVLVGQTSGDPIMMSGDTLRAAFGLAQANSPTFAGLTLSTPLTVANGGTGVASLTNHGILLGQGTSGVVATSAPTNGQVLVGVTGSDPALQSGATLRTSIGLGTADTATFATLNLTNPLGVAYGGTGAASFTAGHVLLGNGTSAIQGLNLTTKGSIIVGDGSGAPIAVAVGTDGQVLTADSGETSGVKWAAGGGGGVGSVSAIMWDGIQVGDSDIATLDFELPFTVSEGPDTYITIGIDGASEIVAGVVELATQAETNTGASDSRAITPLKLTNFTGHTNTATVGTITVGTWNATVIAPAYGGTGLATLTDGGHLLGNGTSAIEVTARPTLGQVLVGQSAGSPVLQSGATLLTTLGVVNNATHSGDAVGSTTLTIQPDVVTNAKLANMAVNTLKGRITSGTGDPEDLTMAQARSILNVEDGASADMTASEIRAALLTVDGPGSGLDADLLDGVQGASYLRSDTSSTFTGVLSITGSLTATGDITANTSDGRLKHQWEELRSVLSHMREVRVGTYEFNDLARTLNPEFDNDRRHLGLVAQDINRYWPEAVRRAPFDAIGVSGSRSGGHYLTLKYELLVPVLWQAVLDLEDQVRELDERLQP